MYNKAFKTYAILGLILTIINTVRGFMYWIMEIRPTLSIADAADGKRAILFMIFLIPTVIGIARTLFAEENTVKDFVISLALGIALAGNVLCLQNIKYPAIYGLYIVTMLAWLYKKHSTTTISISAQ